MLGAFLVVAAIVGLLLRFQAAELAWASLNIVVLVSIYSRTGRRSDESS